MTDAVIFDIDNTLANNFERMSAITRARADRLGVTVEDLRTQHVPWTSEDWEAFHAQCHLDRPIGPVCDIVRGVLRIGRYVPLFVTGRMESCRDVTHRWLWDNVPGVDRVPGWYIQDRLFMRPEGDHRPGHVLKEDILDNLILPRWKPVLAFEDDPAISAMWRRRGILVAHVGDKLS